MIDEFLQLCRALSPMQIVGVLLLLTAGWTLHRWSRDPAYANFKLIYCVSTKSGYPDNAKLREWGAFFTSTYGFFWLLWKNGMSEWYFVGYMAAWVIAGGYSLKKRLEQGEDKPRTRTSTSIQTETETGRIETTEGKEIKL